jgi:hypothetical protein
MESPIISSPLSLRIEDRAASRKKAKLYSLLFLSDSINHYINSIYSSIYLSPLPIDIHQFRNFGKSPVTWSLFCSTDISD